jgi:putative ABC transport system permease protein
LLLSIGLIAGLVLAFATTRTASALLFGIKAHDPLTFVAAGALLALVTAIAGFWPALRASQLDPMAALRWE